MSDLSEYTDKIHIAEAIQFLKQLPDNTIALTITSPPYYDSEIYLLEDGTEEFGWRTYEEYLTHLQTLLDELLRITIESGRIVLALSNSPQTTKNENIVYYWPIIHDLVSYATKNGWYMIDEAVWVKRKPVYPEIKFRSKPNSQLQVHHDIITVLRKPGVFRKQLSFATPKISSVWKMKHFGSISSYNHMYPSFPKSFVKRCIDLWSIPGDIVLDPYAGSGQVCRVALSMDRRTIGIEIDERWESLWTDIHK